MLEHDEDLLPHRIFDAHIHAEFDTVQELEKYINTCRSLRIVGGLTDSSNPSVANEKLASLNIKRCAVAGRGGYDLGGIERGLDEGSFHAMKVNLGFLHAYADDASLLPLYDLAVQRGVPVFFHTGDPGWALAKVKYAHPLTLDDIAVEYPQMKIVLVHAGNPWFADAALVASKNPNVYLDASALLGRGLRDRAPARIQSRVIEPISSILNYMDDPRKLIFGSGWPMVNLPTYIRAHKKAAPKAFWNAIFYENAERLFERSDS